MTRTFALVAPVHRVLHRLSCSYETIPNAPKYYKGPMGWIRCVCCEKSQRHFVARTFALIAPVHPVNCTSSPHFAPSFLLLRNDPKCTQTQWNTPKQGPMGCIRCFCCEKLQRDFVAQTYVLIAAVQYVLQQVSCSYEMIPNAPKYYETDRNISLGSNGVDWVRSLQKIQTWHRGMNFCINCTCAVCFATS